MITPAQIRMARAALGWGVRELAKRARLSPNTVSRIENGGGAVAETLQLMQEAFERAGVEFIPGDATKGPGVRLTRSERTSRTKASGRSKRSGEANGEITKRTQIAETATAWGLSTKKAGARRLFLESGRFSEAIVQRSRASQTYRRRKVPMWQERRNQSYFAWGCFLKDALKRLTAG